MERNDSYGSASRDALLARRAAAARRRATLTLALVVLTAVVGVVAATTALPVWTVAVPGLLLVTVLVLGRRAVVANARADQAAREREAAREAARPAALRRAGRPAPAVRTTVTGRAVHPSQTQTEMISRVHVQEAGERKAAATSTATPADDQPRAKKDQRRAQDENRAADQKRSADEKRHGDQKRSTDEKRAADHKRTADQKRTADEQPARDEQRAPAAAGQPARATAQPASPDATSAAGGADWEPVAVPRPVYTLKSAAPRWEPAPLTAELRKLTEERRAELAAAHGSDGAAADASSAAGSAGQGSAEGASEEPSEDSLGVNLNSVLARRRVAGE